MFQNAFRSRKSILPLLVAALFLCHISAGGRAQGLETLSPNTTRGQVPGLPWVGERGVTETVAALMARRAGSMPRSRLFGRPFKRARRAKREHAHKGAPAVEGPGGRGPRAAGEGPGESEDAADAPQTVVMDFLGATYYDTPGFTPPDAMGAAGPAQFLLCINGRIRSFDKATGVPDGTLDMNVDSFFESVDNATGVSDPRVRFDRSSNRWFVIAINLPSVNNYVLLAVSSGPVITGASSFTFFRFRQDQVAPAGNASQFADYPTLGIDNNALYIGANMFNSAGQYTGTTGWVVRKASVLGAGPIVATAFRGLATANYTAGGPVYSPGPYTPQGVDNDDPNATTGYFIGVDNVDFGKLTLRRVFNPGGVPAISGNIALAVPDTTYPIPVGPLGSDCPLDTLDDRLLHAQMHRNTFTGERTLWTSHAIEVNASGAAVEGGGRVGSRWYEIRDIETAPALKQSGTVFDAAAENPRHYFNPSIAMSGQGHAALAGTYASATEYAGVAVAGRLAADPAGQLSAPTLAVQSLYPYNLEACSGLDDVQRWGDYSFTCVDPEDAMTMWSIQEYTHATDTWGVRILRLQAPPPAVPISVSVPALTPGDSNVEITVTGASTSGEGFYDPGAGYPKRLSASLGAGVTVNAVTFVSPTTIRLSVSVAADAAPGFRTLTITNPDGQSVEAGGLVRVAGPPYAPPDIAMALRIASGLANPTAADALRLNAEPGSPGVDLSDAVRIARKLAGLDANP